MEYLLEVQWTDPVARAVSQLLSMLPNDVEHMTSSVPPDTSRGFAVVKCAEPGALADIAQAVIAAGAEVRVIAGGGRATWPAMTELAAALTTGHGAGDSQEREAEIVAPRSRRGCG